MEQDYRGKLRVKILFKCVNGQIRKSSGLEQFDGKDWNLVPVIEDDETRLAAFELMQAARSKIQLPKKHIIR